MEQTLSAMLLRLLKGRAITISKVVRSEMTEGENPSGCGRISDKIRRNGKSCGPKIIPHGVYTSGWQLSLRFYISYISFNSAAFHVSDQPASHQPRFSTVY